MNRLNLRTPLARWGFTVLAVLALTNDQHTAGIACTAVAIYAWKIR